MPVVKDLCVIGALLRDQGAQILTEQCPHVKPDYCVNVPDRVFSTKSEIAGLPYFI